MKYIIGDSQVGHQRGRTIDENISLITEIIRYINNDAPQAGGLLLMLDHEKAFDRVQWPFMLRCLQAFGIPDSFIRAVRTMYTDISTVIKTNAKLGTPFSVSSGIRQGCVLSALLYVITQEVQLRMIRRSAIRGIQIPGQDGRTDAGHTATVKERALVDDTLVLLRDARDLVELLRVIHAFQRISNHKMNFSKSILVLLGQFSQLDVADSDAPEACTLRDAMSECGLDAGKVYRLSDGEAVQVPKWHGVCIATEKGIEDQCAALADKAAAAATDIVAQQDARKNGARGRETAARWGVAAPVVYPLRYQVPHHTARLDGALDKIQKSMDKVATRGYHGTSNASRRQPRADGEGTDTWTSNGICARTGTNSGSMLSGRRTTDHTRTFMRTTCGDTCHSSALVEQPSHLISASDPYASLGLARSLGSPSRCLKPSGRLQASDRAHGSALTRCTRTT
jgi:hypothetical protein